MRRDVNVAADGEEADRIRAEAMARGYRGFDPAVLLIGTVDEVARDLRRLAEAGFDEVEVRQITDDQRNALASIARLADMKEVLSPSESCDAGS